jgi:EmrB/QacA subfamily drug resistance transporter
MNLLHTRPRAGRPGPNPAFVLAIILASYLMIVLDVSIVITALPETQDTLGFSPTGLSWVQNAYALTFGGLLLLGARVGDIFGRRRTFVAGIALFTAASMLGGLAQSPGWLLAARALQGVGAAIAAPSTLALLTTSFREGPERTRAIAAYSAVAGAGGSVGLVLGGMLTGWVSWRWGLFVNVPIGLALIALAPRHLPETEPRPGRFDVTGAVTSTLGMTAVVYGFVRAASAGWGDRLTAASFALGAALLVAFVLTERRAQQPITPLRLFASRERSGALLARVLVVSAMFSMFFFLTQFLQGVHGYGPLRAGVAFLPLTVAMFAMVRVVPRLARVLDDTSMLTGGLALGLAGMAWMSQLSEGTSYFPQIAGPMLLVGVGIGIAFTPLTAAGIAGVCPRDAGAASGLVNVAHQLGGSLGLGILVTVFASASSAAAEHAPPGPPGIRYELSQAVGTSLTGSAVFLALALAVVVLVMRPVAARGPVTALAEGAA